MEAIIANAPSYTSRFCRPGIEDSPQGMEERKKQKLWKRCGVRLGRWQKRGERGGEGGERRKNRKSILARNLGAGSQKLPVLEESEHKRGESLDYTAKGYIYRARMYAEARTLLQRGRSLNGNLDVRGFERDSTLTSRRG